MQRYKTVGKNGDRELCNYFDSMSRSCQGTFPWILQSPASSYLGDHLYWNTMHVTAPTPPTRHSYSTILT